ncbi:MAG: RNA methyltransferase [Desulfobacteraceae bacterium]|nr:RNA methyltransferase [Desulfobacteraceae bacterium]
MKSNNNCKELSKIRLKTGYASVFINSFKAKPVILFCLMLIIICWHCPLAFAEEFTLPKIDSGKVVLTWTELKLLLEELEDLKQAREKDKQDKKKKKEIPPAEYSVAEAEYNGTVKGETARFESDFSVHVLKDGWVNIPFFPNDVGIESVHIDIADPSVRQSSEDSEQAAGNKSRQTPQFVRNTKGYSLIARGPGFFTIRAVFHIPVQTENLVNTISFVPPRSVINRMSVQIPEKGVRLIQTTPPGSITQKENSVAFQTILSERDTLKLSWRIEKDAGIVRKKQAVFHSLASIGKSSVSVLGRIKLKHVASLDQVGFYLPLNVEIVNLTSPGIDKWHVEQTEEFQVVKIAGQPDPHSSVEISLSYRVRLPELPAKIDIPITEIREIDTLEGYLGVEILGNLEVTSENVRHGMQIPAKNLPKALWNEGSSPLLHGYEFHANGFVPSLNIKSYREIRTVVANVDTVDCVTHRTLEGKSVTRIQYFIRNNDRQFLALTLPEKSRIWQAFLDGKPVKPAQKETGEILIPMKKSASLGEELRSFLIEIGYITDVSKLSLKGDIINHLPGIDIPINYLKWRLYLPEYYGYTKFEGPLKQVTQFSNPAKGANPLIDIPTQGQQFFFEKFLIVDEVPYIKGKYGQFLGNDIFLSVQPGEMQSGYQRDNTSKEVMQQVIPNFY